MPVILVTGGAGYIGSHTSVALVENGYDVVVVDNFSNSKFDAIARVEFLSRKKVTFYELDICNHRQLSRVFMDHKFDGVIHFAALKAVAESSRIPIDYYENNLGGAISLMKCMSEHGVKTLVFSSSATVYGDVTRFDDQECMIPIPETCPVEPSNPYGRTKHNIECLLHDLYNSGMRQTPTDNWKIAILRYFNPIGAHPLGSLGEDPSGIPNNLLPCLAQVACKRHPRLNIYGSDYDTCDGTPIRDYIHISDLVQGHIAALQHLEDTSVNKYYRVWNLGTGTGTTVFQVYEAFCKAVGFRLPFELKPRRAGDVPNLTANPGRAHEELAWEATLSLDRACIDLWRWTTLNPMGFAAKGYSWKLFGKDADWGNRVHTIEKGPLKVLIANFGATIVSIQYDNIEVVKNYPDINGYMTDRDSYCGATIGRYANRISGATAIIDGIEYAFDANDGSNLLHGGKEGYSHRFWLGPNVVTKDGATTLEFCLTDDSSESAGFPGNLITVARYTLCADALVIEYESTSDCTTIVNLTNHTYFNLCGSPTIDRTIATLHANKRLELEGGVPTGNILEVSDTPRDLDQVWDDCIVVSTENFTIDTRERELVPLIDILHPDLEIRLVISSTEPAFQLYTGDHLSDARSGFCVEPSRYVNAINVPDWDLQVILKPDQVYGSKTQYRFSHK